MAEQVCDYEKCSETFIPKRPHQRFHHESCRYAQWELDKEREEASGSSQRVDGQTTHPLQLVREEQEQAKEKARWTLLAREHLARTLLETGYAHADDFDALSVPDDHRNVIGSQMGSFVARGYMEEVSRRASANPKRKKAKSAVYRLTDKGRKDLSELLSPLVGSNRQESSGEVGSRTVRSGEKEIVGVDVDHHGDGEGEGSAGLGVHVPPSSVGVDPGELGPNPTTVGAGQLRGKSDQGRQSPSAAAGTDSPDSLVQLDGARKAPSMYDPMEDAAA